MTCRIWLVIHLLGVIAMSVLLARLVAEDQAFMAGVALGLGLLCAFGVIDEYKEIKRAVR